ncbi:alpha-ribazole phosphatase family protein [Vibrio metoecus]|uniref:alpha-ribazole phosphatase family protein n=1 Tax=Vibrio metoecus TaxID=1481663 RepID=UPI000BA91169|nr:alpha-ribazole phosphatase family protein [Vibrio metoecus]PAR45308.1 alpha-ribazole phosphatase [Vibrio metoecus]WKY92185.1 alpha-ribazole phosphatase family protein [Vibrio metoecus]
MARIYLLRHGKTQGPAALNGITDVAVDADVQQAIASRLLDRSFTRVISSPLRRCADLAQRIHHARPDVILDYDANLQEMNFGLFDGQSFSNLEQEWPLLDAFWKDPAHNTLPQAESLASAYQRVTQAWQQWLPQMEGDTLVICHAGTIRLILAHILGVDWRNPDWYSRLSIPYQSISELTLYRDEPYFVSVNSIGNVL